MIAKANFKDVLKTLGFTEEGNTFQKSIGETDLKVDFDKNEIIYPEDKGLKVNERQTCNFSQNENFVVFECIHRLLEKGYKPEHLELEPRWRVGRGASGGRADILVRNHEKNPLLIIECKTAGDEFDKAWRKTLQDGDQLFSYAQQIRRTQYLCLYASDFVENGIRIDQKIIAHRDDENILAQDDTSRSFAEAADVEDRYTVWRETYQLEYAENGIFEDNVQAYQIGKNKYTLAEDTKPIDASDKEGKYHEFRTILRKHNIARRENAFEVLVNLFLCKLVDEEDNTTDLKFYWKGITYDNYFDFVDRLQDLYRKGMRKFLNEEISYISNEQIDNAFWTIKNKRNATKQQIQRYFRKLKFFTNSAFSLLDTHNEELFKRNTKVLSEIVQMWEKLRLKTDNQNQFLGDMFEFFLDNGIKQSEGQFFTPLPICKFIVASLPLAQKIESNAEPIKAIDYACGSGHFLNEYAYQIRPLVETHYRDISDYYSQITGIEKEDRLAKVAKVAAYMHGQEQIKILDADALAIHPEIQKENFDVLIANPPFAVEGFLQTLNEEDKKEYQLIKAIGENSNTDTIECFFLERLHHLMAPSGIVGVIVPSSILSNTDAVFTGTREILLQFFDIVSIAELGSGTFGKTGTNTVVLFLRRKVQRPELAEHYRNRVDDFFEGDRESEEYQDHYLIEAYCEYIEVPSEEYIKLFVKPTLTDLTELLQYDIFNSYKQAFEQSTEIKNLKKSNAFKKKKKTEKSTELEQRFVAYLHEIEKEKLYYFILAHEQVGNVLIVKAPGKTSEQKQFLGYGWSTRKGEEGIKYEGGAKTVNDIISPLFDPKDLDNDSKINTTIKRNFIGETVDPLPEHCQYAKLTDMLNFSRVDFDKIISLNPQQNINIETQWPLVKLGDEIETIESGNRPKGGVGNISSGAWSLGGEHIHPTTGTVDLSIPKYVPLDFYHGSTRGILQENDILLCKDGALTGKIALLRNELNDEKVMVNEHVFLLRCSSQLKQYYIFNFLFCQNGQNLLKQNITGSAQGGLNSTNLKEIKIPLPPSHIQEQIVDECKAVDQETDQAHQTITDAKQRIEALVSSVEKASMLNEVVHRISDIINPKEKNGSIYYVGLENIESQTGVLSGNPQSDFSNIKSNKNVFRRGDILYGKLRPNLNKVHLANIDGICSTDILVFRPYDPNLATFYKHYFLSEGFNSEVIKTVSGQQLPRTSWEKIERILVPSSDVQQQLVAEVEQLEAKITEAQAVIDKAIDRKNAILKKYLQKSRANALFI